MRRTRSAPVPVLAVVLALGLGGCAAAPAAAPSTTATISATTPAATETADATTPTSDAAVTVSLDGAATAGGATLSYTLDAIDTWTTALGAAPTESPLESPPGYDFEMTVFEWPGMKLIVPNDGSEAGSSISVSSPTVAGHHVVTTQGIGVGATRADAVAAGAVEGFDATELRLDVRDVPGTQSLQREGQVGREYVMLILDGDSVVSIQLPANDFSDL